MRLLLLNGPNLNLLGTRAPEVYGSTTLPELETLCRGWAEERGHVLEGYQSNHEGALIDTIHGARGVFDGIVFNPGAYTHTSYALHDAIEAAEVPTVEIHISNVRAREAWRRESRIGPACTYQIFGRGIEGYRYAIDRLHYDHLSPATIHGVAEPDQVGDLRLPDGDGPHPVVMLIHGGFWREVWTRDTLDGLAIDLQRRGFATWNVEYRRIPPIGAWRTTIDDVVDAGNAVTALAESSPIDPDDVTLLGHSAGAHLAVMAATRLVRAPRRLLLLGGVLDLDILEPGHDALPLFLGDELETHRSAVNPREQAPTGVSTLAVHGSTDDSVPPDHSRNYVAAAGDEAELLELEESDHWDVIDPSSEAWDRVAERLTTPT